MDDLIQESKYWRNALKESRQRFEHLIFFNVQQILCLFKLINEKKINNLVSYVAVVFPRYSFKREFLQQIVDSLNIPKDIPTRIGTTGIVTNDETPSLVLNSVGEFVSQVSQNIPKEKNPFSLPIASEKKTPLVISAQNCTDENLFYLLLHLYESRLPEHFELFFCSKNTTETEINLLLKKEEKIKGARFSLIHVNKLTYSIRDYLLKSQIKRGPKKGNFNYIFTEPIGMEGFYSLESEKWVEADFQKFPSLVEIKSKIQKERMEKISGKTKEISQK